VRLPSFGVFRLWIVRDECFFEYLFSNLKHVFHCTMNVRRRIKGLKFVVKDQFKGSDETIWQLHEQLWWQSSISFGVLRNSKWMCSTICS
jgi:hypothetical protein